MELSERHRGRNHVRVNTDAHTVSPPYPFCSFASDGSEAPHRTSSCIAKPGLLDHYIAQLITVQGSRISALYQYGLVTQSENKDGKTVYVLSGFAKALKESSLNFENLCNKLCLFSFDGSV